MTNIVVLRGRLSRGPEQRDLPSGDRLTAFDLTVRDAGRTRAESVPLAWINAPGWVADLDAGGEVVVMGRVRRRFFRAGAGLQSRTEVVVEHGAPARHAARCGAVLRRCVDALAGDPAGGDLRRR